MKNFNYLRNWRAMVALICGLLFMGNAHSQTLAQGDISITAINGFEAGGNDRGVCFVTWVQINSGTEIRFTDNGFNTTGASTSTNGVRWQETVLIWTANSTVAPGTVVCIADEAATTGTANVINASGTDATVMNLSNTGGDQVFAYQGQNMPTTTTVATGATLTFNNTILFGIGYQGSSSPNTTWLATGPAGTATSCLPSDLVSPNRIYHAASCTGAQFTGLRTGSTLASDYKTAIALNSNWTTYTANFTNDAIPFALGTPPSITGQPSAATPCAGASPTFTVTATGTSLTYQWQVSTTGTGGTYSNVTSSGGLYTNFTTATLTINNVTAGMNGYAYRCVVSGSASPAATSNGALLTVNSAPSITGQPASPSAICAGNNTSITVGASGAGLTYQWQVSPTGTGGTYNNVTSSGGLYTNFTTATLNINGATAGMNGYAYRCVVSGTCTPFATSNGAVLTVNSAPSIISQPSSPTSVCDSDDPGNISVTATGSGLTYQWQVSTTGPSGTFNNVSGGFYTNPTSATMYISGVTTSMNGYAYRVIVGGTCSPNATSNGNAVLSVTANVTYYEDWDNDGYGNGSVTTTSCTGPQTGFVSNFDDCDDSDPNVYPGAVEICYDGIDNNCDGNTDEGCTPLTQLAASDCGTTLEYLNTQYISADPVIGAEQYEFRITNGAYVATATDNLQAGKVRIIQFVGYSYNTTYQVAVRAKVGGVWGIFNSECPVTTTSAPHSELDPTQCNTTLPAMNTIIYTSTVNGATQYRFRIINGANVQTIDRPVRSFNLTMLASYEYNTTYAIDVAVEFGGSWHPYSTACNITTPTLGTSVVLPTQCSTTLAAVTSSIFSNQVSGATQYRYRVTNGANVQTIDKPTASFKLTELATYAFSTTYTIDVAVEYNGMWQAYGSSCSVATPAITLTQVQASQCGATLASMTTYIYANSVSGATQYRFRFTEGANTQTYVSATRAMNVTMLANHMANTTYSVEVAAMLNGTWGAYGPVCTITTPPVPTKVQSSQCGTTLSKLDKLIYADAINLATAYRFRVTNGANVQTIDRTTNSFYLTQLASYAYGINYTIDVSVQYGGVWQPYGSACMISTPAAGSVTTTLISTSCGIIVSSNSQALVADKVVGATQYEFLVENAGLSYSQSVVNNTFTFSLSQLTGITNTTTYTVKVRTKVNNIWSPYGAACNVGSEGTWARPGSSATEGTIAAGAFDAVTFPNPFSGVFGVKVSTPSTETIYVTVYDMSGKVMESHTATPEEIQNLDMGKGFAAGIYQVRVIQGTETKTMKVVKQ